MEEEIVLEVKRSIFQQAEAFLLEVGTFGPFGIVYKNNSVTPVGYYNDESEIVDSEKAIRIIKNIFSDDLRSGSTTAGCVAYDVAANFPNADGELTKRDAMCIETSINGINWVEEYFPYMIIDRQVVWM